MALLICLTKGNKRKGDVKVFDAYKKLNVTGPIVALSADHRQTMLAGP